MDLQLLIPVNTFRTRAEGLRLNRNVFAVVHRVYRPEQDLMLFITTNLPRLEHHLHNDLNLMGNQLSKGTLDAAKMDFGTVQQPMTELAIPELLRRAFSVCFFDEFHLDEFLNAKVTVSSRLIGTSIAHILGRQIH
jgi:hypothetical protein